MFCFKDRMFKNRRTQSGQTAITEYVVIFFLAIGALVAMSVYIQRTLQARIHDSRDYMISEAARAHEGPIHYEYEPYYGYVATNVQRNQDDTTRLLGSGATGIFRKTLNQAVNSSTISQQAAPKNAL